MQHLPGCTLTPIIGLKKTLSNRELFSLTFLKLLDLQQLWGTLNVGTVKPVSLHYNLRSFTIHTLRDPIVLGSFSNCESHDKVYMTVQPCQKLYVGLSRRSTKVRILEQVARIHNQVLDVPLTLHHIQAGHQPEELWFLDQYHPHSFSVENIDMILHKKDFF